MRAVAWQPGADERLGKRYNCESISEQLANAEKAGLSVALAGAHGVRLVLPPSDPQPPGVDWRTCLELPD